MDARSVTLTEEQFLRWLAPQKDVLNRKEAAAFIGVTVKHFRDHIESQIPHVKKSPRIVYFRKSDILKWQEMYD